MVRMQVTDIRKSLMSVSKVCDAGHRVTFTAHGGCIEHIETGQVTNFERRGGVCILNVKLDDSCSNARRNTRSNQQDVR